MPPEIEKRPDDELDRLAVEIRRVHESGMRNVNASAVCPASCETNSSRVGGRVPGGLIAAALASALHGKDLFGRP